MSAHDDLYTLSVGAVEFAPDEQSVTVAGRRFKAVEADEPGRCTATPRCAFVMGFSCALYRPGEDPRCRPSRRQDGRSIVWIRGVQS